jgi:hypothetical protein
MSANWKRPLISAHERDIRELLEEIRAADDCDLWEEVAAKLCDVLIVYRKAMKARTIRFSDERVANLSEMAFTHAFAEVFGDEANPDVI